MKRIRQNTDMNLGKNKTKQHTDIDAGKKKNKNEPNWQDGTLTVEEIKDILRLSRTKTYELVNRGAFPVIRIDNVIRIPKTGFDRWFRESCA